MFAENFICALSVLKVEEIPFSTNQFNNGISKLQNYLINQKDKCKNLDKLDMLFMKEIFTGNYTEMSNALQIYLGSGLGFVLEAPYYKIARIKTCLSLAHDILNEFENIIPKEIMLNSAKEFCYGAGVKIS